MNPVFALMIHMRGKLYEILVLDSEFVCDGYEQLCSNLYHVLVKHNF